MKVAIEGCCHGELPAIYAHIAALDPSQKPDVLLICGDFQAVRNHQDLLCMSVPEKFRKLGGFCKYYTGEETAPLLTIVIGGNHEASNYMWELFHGGWLAPNIYFLGNSGCLRVNGLRVAGMSGIFNKHHYSQGFFEVMPYTHSTMRSIYHVREYNHKRLSLLSKPNIFLSHDWPASIEHHGDLSSLLRRKPFFREDVQKKALGSPPLWDLLLVLKPDWWFSAHLHVKYEACYVHPGVGGAVAAAAGGANPDEIVIGDDDDDETDAQQEKEKEAEVKDEEERARNPDEIMLDDEEADVAPPLPPPPPPTQTRFLALDKCIPGSRRQFLEVIDIPSPESHSPPSVTFDPEWLAITRVLNPSLSTGNHLKYPDKSIVRDLVAKELEWVKAHVPEGGNVPVSDVQTFCITAPGPSPETEKSKDQPRYYPNPQTAAFCTMLEIENKIDPQNMTPV